MKAKDLMIGDWVNIAIEEYNNPTRIREIGSFWVKVIKDEMEYGNILVTPIPLTPEILEKNGFEKVLDEDGTECHRYYNSAADGYIKISLYNCGDGDWSVEIINYEKFDDNEIVYNNNFTFLKVHQLQHALKLCGITKEIEL